MFGLIGLRLGRRRRRVKENKQCGGWDDPLEFESGSLVPISEECGDALQAERSEEWYRRARAHQRTQKQLSHFVKDGYGPVYHRWVWSGPPWRPGMPPEAQWGLRSSDCYTTGAVNSLLYNRYFNPQTHQPRDPALFEQVKDDLSENLRDSCQILEFVRDTAQGGEANPSAPCDLKFTVTIVPDLHIDMAVVDDVGMQVEPSFVSDRTARYLDTGLLVTGISQYGAPTAVPWRENGRAHDTSQRAEQWHYTQNPCQTACRQRDTGQRHDCRRVWYGQPEGDHDDDSIDKRVVMSRECLFGMDGNNALATLWPPRAISNDGSGRHREDMVNVPYRRLASSLNHEMHNISAGSEIAALLLLARQRHVGTYSGLAVDRLSLSSEVIARRWHNYIAAIPELESTRYPPTGEEYRSDHAEHTDAINVAVNSAAVPFRKSHDPDDDDHKLALGDAGCFTINEFMLTEENTVDRFRQLAFDYMLPRPQRSQDSFANNDSNVGFRTRYSPQKGRYLSGSGVGWLCEHDGQRGCRPYGSNLGHQHGATTRPCYAQTNQRYSVRYYGSWDAAGAGVGFGSHIVESMQILKGDRTNIRDPELRRDRIQLTYSLSNSNDCAFFVSKCTGIDGRILHHVRDLYNAEIERSAIQHMYTLPDYDMAEEDGHPNDGAYEEKYDRLLENIPPQERLGLTLVDIHPRHGGDRSSIQSIEASGFVVPAGVIDPRSVVGEVGAEDGPSLAMLAYQYVAQWEQMLAEHEVEIRNVGLPGRVAAYARAAEFGWEHNQVRSVLPRLVQGLAGVPHFQYSHPLLDRPYYLGYECSRLQVQRWSCALFVLAARRNLLSVDQLDDQSLETIYQHTGFFPNGTSTRDYLSRLPPTEQDAYHARACSLDYTRPNSSRRTLLYRRGGRTDFMVSSRSTQCWCMSEQLLGSAPNPNSHFTDMGTVDPALICFSNPCNATPRDGYGDGRDRYVPEWRRREGNEETCRRHCPAILKFIQTYNVLDIANGDRCTVDVDRINGICGTDLSQPGPCN